MLQTVKYMIGNYNDTTKCQEDLNQRMKTGFETGACARFGRARVRPSCQIENRTLRRVRNSMQEVGPRGPAPSHGAAPFIEGHQGVSISLAHSKLDGGVATRTCAPSSSEPLSVTSHVACLSDTAMIS